MKKRIIGSIIIAAVLFIPALAQEELKFSNYQDMRAYVGKLYQEKKFAEAAQVLEKALAQFPDRLRANAFNLALMRVHLKDFDKAAQGLRLAVDKGIFFNKYDFMADLWTPLKEQAAFKEFWTRNEAVAAEAQKRAKPEMVVVTPEGYDPGKKYPLFIALHGGGENISTFKDSWKSDRLAKEFVTAYLQSSRVIGVDSYNWTEDIEISKREIVDAYRKILSQYPVNEEDVTIGGFSSGAVASFEILLNGLIPIKGFITLCPAKPKSFTAENIQKAKEKGVSGVLLTTEMEGADRLSQQKDMDAIMTAAGLPHQFVITPNIGHWYPADLASKIDAGIEFIRQNQKKKT